MRNTKEMELETDKQLVNIKKVSAGTHKGCFFVSQLLLLDAVHCRRQEKAVEDGSWLRTGPAPATCLPWEFSYGLVAIWGVTQQREDHFLFLSFSL